MELHRRRTSIRLALAGTSIAWVSAAALSACGGDTASTSATPGLSDAGDATVTVGPGVGPEGGDSAAFDGPGGDAAVDAPADLCAAYARAECAVSSRCTGFTPGPGCYPGALAADEQACRGSLAAGGSGQSVALVAQCTASLGTMSCSEYLKGKRDPSCTAQGSFVEGRPCSYGAQCATGRCAFGATQCGACAAPSPAGAPCNDASTGVFAGCVEGATCVAATPMAPLTCAPYAGLDESCDSAHPCGRSLYCVSGKCVLASDAGPCLTANGVGVPCAPQLVTLRQGGLCACVAPQPANAPCAAPTSPLAATLACAAGTYCAGDGATPGQGHCAPRAAEGQPCAFNLSTLQASACSDPDKDYCGATATSSGTCLPLPTLGQPCTGLPDAGALSSIEKGRCGPGTACDQSAAPPTCVAAPGIGEPCSASTFSCVVGSYCDGVCKPNPTAGQPCGQVVNGRFVVCANDLYCRAGACAPLPKLGESCGDVPHVAVRCADRGFCQIGAQDASTCVPWCQ